MITHANKKTETWRADIRNAAREHAPDQLWRGPVFVAVRFELSKPKSIPKKTVWPIKKPDLDKLARAVLDALTDVIWKDDSQVTTLSVAKCYGDAPGAWIELTELEF